MALLEKLEEKTIPLKFTLNGRRVQVAVKPNATLADVLRTSFKLTGTKVGCELGECGSCTVILDGRPVMSCLMLAPQVRNREVLTIEGLGTSEKLHPIQQAFLDNFATQCGSCIPGMIMAAKALLDENPSPTEAEVKQALKGNLCRCTGYVQQIQAVMKAAKKIKK
ncbi:MAG: (2Fe-2S)-binding protein [Candidatus Bathyarchaeia archaeon]